MHRAPSLSNLLGTAVSPYRSKTFKLSTDPLFVEKVRNSVGLYLNAPDHATVLAPDEKPQIQAAPKTGSLAQKSPD